MEESAARLAAAVQRLAGQTQGRPATGSSHEDADDLVGTAGTADAVGFDPRPVLRALSRHGARVVVMGQVAGILHGSRELTGDLDLLWDGNPDGTPALARAFADMAAALYDGEGRPAPAAPFGLPKLLFRTGTAAGDLCTPVLPWGDVDVHGALRRAVTADLGDGCVVHHVSLVDLIAMRRAVGRPKDLRRAAELEMILLATR